MNAYEIETIEHTRQDDYVDHIDLPDNTPLSKIAMLGSHDAGTYAYSKRRNKNRIPRSLGEAFPGAFKTQNKTLVEQAEAGARYFDIRVARNKDNSFSFFHGPSVASGNAVDDVIELLQYAAKDTNNFYLIKFVFKGESKKNTVSRKNAASDVFLETVLKNYHGNLITKNDTLNLGDASVDLLNKGKNIGIMVHGYNGVEKDFVYPYKEQVNTKWANRADAEETAKSLTDFHTKPAPANKLNIIQTNMPFANVRHREVTRGVKNYLSRKKNILADAINNILHPGIISADYIGDDKSATPEFINRIKLHNQELMRQ
ncbi:hypothetical protein [Xenorhabdus sp. KK7.4]|uniref:hypothetical protein n=1 Tax=Xenorhabdus sp. KK7.4 TaxID=1851572 RepID=UPI000C0395CF|nr:hypothetical protein [Xenorhabdus sp. KK7.4]PHM59047.1 glycosylphosphatidylinositol diacylglycerol-lyase phosphatidylinositol-specific phospholipase C [Xenorhabdus sp. KK7.4]